MVKVTVVTVSGAKIQVEIQPNETVLRIKEEVQLVTGIHPSQLRLIRKGQMLDDTMAMECLGIQDGETIHVVNSLVAGGIQ